MTEFWKNIGAGIISTILGGIMLALLLFVFDEWVFPPKNLTGEWSITTTTLSSRYKPFENVKQEFIFEFLQKATDIIASGEKSEEINPDGRVIVFNPEKRVRLEMTGYMERNYIRRSRVFLNIIERGERAVSTTTFFLTFIDNDHLKGTFISTVSNSKGEVLLSRSSQKP